MAKAKAYKQARQAGADIAGLNEWNVRWVGPDGYKGMVARQLKAFREAQKSRAASTDGDEGKGQ